MKTTKALFFALMYDFQSERWNEFELPKLSLRELLALAKLFGCPSCGSKEAVIVRLLAHRELRLKLARFADNLEELANSYQQEETAPTTPIWRGIPNSTVARSAIPVAIPVARAVRCFSSIEKAKCAEVAKAS